MGSRTKAQHVVIFVSASFGTDAFLQCAEWDSHVGIEIFVVDIQLQGGKHLRAEGCPDGWLLARMGGFCGTVTK